MELHLCRWKRFGLAASLLFITELLHHNRTIEARGGQASK